MSDCPNPQLNDAEMLDFIANSSMIFSGYLTVIDSFRHRLESIEEQFITFPWIPLSMISEMKDLSRGALIKQLQSGDFEEGKDFKHDGNKIVVHQRAIPRLKRKRRRYG